MVCGIIPGLERADMGMEVMLMEGDFESPLLAILSSCIKFKFTYPASSGIGIKR